MMHNFLKALLLLVLAASLAAQDPAPRRPKIGLALAGGSALGLTHVGVLKWLEQERIPIDYIAGTSMGALIGGMFATGRDAAEVEDFVRTLDWNFAFQSTVPFRQFSFRRKEDQREYPNPLEFGLRRGIRLPSGLSSGHGVALMISRFAAPYGELESFDDLPTPFRCIAVDLVEAREVVFDSGSLPEALRATMSLPAVFAPVRKDEMLLVDGGMLNNLPVEVVRQMGADIVIAVALDLPTPDIHQLNSLFGVARRSLSVMVIDNERRNLGLASIVIRPDANGVGASDYLRWAELAGRGYDAAEKLREHLAPLRVSDEDYQRWAAARRLKRLPDTVRPQFIEVGGQLAPRRRDAMLDAIAADPSRPFDRDSLEEELSQITGMGRYDDASYTLVRRGAQEGLRLSLHEKEHGPPFLKPGIVLDANRGDGIQFGIGARLTFLDFGGPASEWRTDFSIGVLNRIGTEYYYRIQGRKWFIAPRIGYEESQQGIYEGRRRLADYTTQLGGGGADIGYAFGRFREFRLGWTVHALDTHVSQGERIAPSYNGTLQQFRARFVYEGQDSAIIPRTGARVALEASYVTHRPGATRKYPVFDGLVSHAKTLPARLLLITSAAAGATVVEEPLFHQFALGGPLRMTSLARGQVQGNRYYYGSGALLRSLTSESLGTFGRFYGLVSYEAGNAWFDRDPARPRHSASLGLMGETAIGVVFFGGAIGDRGDRRVFFRLGRFF